MKRLEKPICAAIINSEGKTGKFYMGFQTKSFKWGQFINFTINFVKLSIVPFL